jgi:streptomycin 6-kinase
MRYPPGTAGAAADLLPAADDRLLHSDLHFDNVLRAGSASDRAGQWLAIDPKPLAGESGFELLPALHNRWDQTAVRRRFDPMTEIMGLDRQRAAAWTLVRVLQNLLWDFEDGNPFDPDQPDVVIAAILLRTL